MVAYKRVQNGPLKLKGDAELGMTKWKKEKQKDKDKLLGTSKKNEKEKRRPGQGHPA